VVSSKNKHPTLALQQLSKDPSAITIAKADKDNHMKAS